MDPLIVHNNRIVSIEEARLSPGQAGLLTGWGVFTTLRLYRGHPFAFERHWARLARDAACLRVPFPYKEADVRNAIRELASANHRPEGIARVSLVRNQGSLWTQADDKPPADLLVFTRELVTGPAAYRLSLQPAGILSASPYAGVKMLSWATYAAAFEKARTQGFDDALLLNEKGQLAECTSANLFLVVKGGVLTPPLSSGCLPGVTREILVEIAGGSGIELVEQDLFPKNLSFADEVFISSSTREVAPVSFINPRYEFPAPGKITLALEEAFRRYVQTYLDHNAV